MLSELECDINSTDDDILQQINESRIVSLLTEIIDDEPVACLSVVIPRILSRIDDENSDSEYESEDSTESDYESNEEESSESESDDDIE